MLVAFFESLKYTGHIWPIAILRIYLGYFYLQLALERLRSEFLTQPLLAATMTEWLPRSQAPRWYREWVDSYVLPNWQIFAYTLMYCEFLIAISLLLGFLVRPAALLGIFLALNLIVNSSPEVSEFHQMRLILFIVLGLVGAGRCLGIDAYFYKRQRGLWW